MKENLQVHGVDDEEKGSLLSHNVSNVLQHLELSGLSCGLSRINL